MAYTSPGPAGLTNRRVLFLFSKIVTGVGVGGLITTCQTYVSEVAPVKLRGGLLAFFPFFVAIGQMIGITLVFSRIMIFNTTSFTVSPQDITRFLGILILTEIPFAAQWAFSGLAIISAILLPESPAMLLEQGKTTAAHKAYLRLHGSNTDADVALSRIQATLDHEKAQQNGRGASFSECFKRTDLRRTLIISLVALLQYFLGVSLVAHSNYFLIMAGMSPTQSLQISQIGVSVQLVATVIASITMTCCGRRTIVLWSELATGIMFVGMGVAGFYQSKAEALR